MVQYGGFRSSWLARLLHPSIMVVSKKRERNSLKSVFAISAARLLEEDMLPL